MAEVQIQSMSHRHMAIADWLLSNPERKLSVCAMEMGVSQSWLSIVIHSDLFREYFAQRRAMHEMGLRERIVGAQLKVTLSALAALDSLMESDEVDGRLVLDTAERIANQLGFSPRASARVIEERTQEITAPVSAGILAEARERMRRTVITERPATLDDMKLLPNAAAG